MDLHAAGGHRGGVSVPAVRTGLPHDGDAGDAPVHAPQGLAALWLRRVRPGVVFEDPADVAVGVLADQYVADGVLAEPAGLVGARARDEAGDDVVEAGVSAGGPGQVGVAQAGAGAADQGVVDLSVVPSSTRVRGWSEVPASSATKAGTWVAARRSTGPSAPPIIQVNAAYTGASRQQRRSGRRRAAAIPGRGRSCGS